MVQVRRYGRYEAFRYPSRGTGMWWVRKWDDGKWTYATDQPFDYQGAIAKAKRLEEAERLQATVEQAKAEEALRKRELAGALMGPEDIENLQRKLNPRRFPGMSSKMAAIVGYILDKKWTEPAIDEMAVTSDGFVMASSEYDVGMNQFIGAVSDLERNWENLLEAADLTFEERRAAEQLFTTRVLDSRYTPPEEM